MTSLASLFAKVGDSVRKDLLRDVVVFPKTASLHDDQPITTIEMQGTISWSDVRAFAAINTELIALGACEDVDVTLRALEDVQTELQLDQFDSIRLSRGCVNLLSIINTKRQVGRSANVEIFEYRRRLSQRRQDLDWSSYALAATVVIFLRCVWHSLRVA